jgi:hypothetical protein
MSRLLKTLIIVAALGCITTSTQALSAEFKYHYFIGMINPKSWDGPWWWGLRSSVADVAVSHVSGREIRSDRAGHRAFAVSFKLSNIGDNVAGRKALVLGGADQSVSDRFLSALRPALPDSAQTWSVGEPAVVAALAPGESAEASIIVYQEATRALDETEQAALVELEVSAQ